MTQQDNVQKMKKMMREWLIEFTNEHNIPLKKERNKLILSEVKFGIRGSAGGTTNNHYGLRDTKESEYDYLIFCVTNVDNLTSSKDIQFVLLDSQQLVKLKLILGTSDKSFKMNKYHTFIDFFEFESEMKKILQLKKEYFVDEIDRLNSVIEEELMKYESEGYDEGTKKMMVHYLAERNATVVRKAKELFELKNGHLFCDICKFDYFEAYGTLGNGYIEAHHKKPLSLNGQTTTEIEDLALLCASCHRMIHKLMKIQLNDSYEELRRSLKERMDAK